MSRTVVLDVQSLVQLKHAASHLCTAALHEPFQLPGSADSTGLTRGFRSNFYFISNAKQSAGCIILSGKGQGLRQHQAAFWEAGCKNFQGSTGKQLESQPGAAPYSSLQKD